MSSFRFLIIALLLQRGACSSSEKNDWQRWLGSDISECRLDSAIDKPVSKGSDISCDFDSGSCCWSNANKTVDQRDWVLLKGNPSSHKFKKTFDTSKVPSGHFLGVKGKSSSDKAVLYSCPIQCADGEIKVSVKHWQTEDVEIQVCQFTDNSGNPHNCQDLSDNNGKTDSVSLPGGENKRLAVIASELSSGSVALIDDIRVQFKACGSDNGSTGDGLIWTQKENYYCISDSDQCIPDVGKCCEDNSVCQKASGDSIYRCSPINKGVTNCGVHPLIAKCDYSGYDNTMPPAMALNGSPTLVYVRIHLRNIMKQEDTGLYVLDMFIRQFYNDTRLAHKENRVVLYRKQEHLDSIWLPDLHFSISANSYKQKWLTSPHSLRIYQDGFIRLSQRIQVVTACGSSTCELRIESYGVVEAYMKVIWEAPDAPITIDSSINATVTGASTGYCTNEAGSANGRTYSCLLATFNLKN